MSNVRGTRVDISELVKGLEAMAGAQESIGRTMAHSMGVEVRDEAKLRAPVGTEEGGSITPGLLRSAIYVAYDARRNVMNPNAYRYVVSWNSKKAPHGHLLEFGHWMPYLYATDGIGNFWTPNPEKPQPNGPFWVAQRAFLGPAFDAKLPRLAGIAFQAGSERFKELVA